MQVYHIPTAKRIRCYEKVEVLNNRSQCLINYGCNRSSLLQQPMD